jgi:hypothetical protein
MYCFQHAKFNEEEDCPICFESLKGVTKTSVTSTTCKHSFHKSCLNKWLDKHDSCPCCRTKLKELPPHTPIIEVDHENIHSIRMEHFNAILIQLIHENNQRHINNQQRHRHLMATTTPRFRDHQDEMIHQPQQSQQEQQQPRRSLFARLFCMFA